MKNSKAVFGILLSIFTIAFLFRYSYIRENHFQFHYEQSRDALVSREIIEVRDFKIQGPSAGNTEGTIYHGVLYYYFLGPLYTISGGNPAIVVFTLALLNSSVIIPIFLICKDLFKNKKVGLLAGFLYAFSLDATQMGTHLQNISFAAVIIPWLLYFALKVFLEKKKNFLPILALTLGITHQFGIYLGYFIIPITLIFFLGVKLKNILKFFSANQLVKASLIYILSISSIIITQVKLFRVGIFSLSNISKATSSHQNILEGTRETFRLYFEKISNSYLTLNKEITLCIFLFIVVFLIFEKNLNKKSLIFLLIWLFSPFILFGLVPRKIYYMMVGIIPAMSIVFSMFVINFSKTKIQKLLTVLLLISFFVSNIKTSKIQRLTATSPLYVSAQLWHELALIDKTYQIAQGEQFSISSLTSPYKVNTTWAYLYDWYGKKKYGYKPIWFGADQKGLPGDNLLTQNQNTLPQIFSGVPLSSHNFGELKLEVRKRI